MITAKNISKSYGTLEVLKGVSVEIKDSEIVSIVGASGAGKTTIVRHLLEHIEELAFSISATTREKRYYEQDGNNSPVTG